MRTKSIQLQKRAVMAVTTFLILATGCDDRFDSRGGHPSGEGKMVDVTLDIGLADEADSYDLSGTPGMSGTASTSSTSSTKTGMDHESAFDFRLVPSQQTKAGTFYQPDALYNLEIRQYNSSNGHLRGATFEKIDLGTKITLALQEATRCQLVLVAWGAGNNRRLGTGALDAVKDTIGSYLIKDLDPANQQDMNKMPYVLHLKDVNVSSDGRIYSKDGEAVDVRLRLQRLAARLTFTWDYKVDGYTPQQILIHSIPTQYKVVASPDKKDNTYPSLLDQFTTIQYLNSTTAGSYSCWIPANVRGSNPAATSQLYRIKSNAPTGSSYIRFIAVNNTDAKKKLDYRIYLGGKETTDFNLYGNHDYAYEAAFKHSSTNLPVNDLRVTIVDPIPASQDNNNFVPTANCFMVAPGGAFCFNPYKYTVNGSPVDNTLLKGWCPEGTKIQSVKVLWQTLENGDVGDPVLGTANSSADHTNIVDLTDGANFDKARIYCCVAPNTTGGSGVIAAYDGANGTGNILWSWHVWVTEYSPNPTGNESVDDPLKRKQKYTNRTADQLPMMDRNLGAMAGYTETPPSALEKSKTHGFHYQWGRKDLFPSSYTSDPSITEIPADLSKPTRGLLNLYQPDGISYYKRDISTSNPVSFQEAYRHPAILYKPARSTGWNTLDALRTAWGGDADKTVHDPCPVGWRVTKINDYNALFQSDPGINTNTPLNLANSNFSADGGTVVRFESNEKGSRTTYIRFTGYWNGTTTYSVIGSATLLWCRDNVNSLGTDGNNRDAGRLLEIRINKNTNQLTTNALTYTGWLKEALPVRCIQEQK